jgi:hypothetical protein
MHITNITIQNIRGVSGSWDIGPAAMIIADNFAGKSAVLSGIRLGVFGYLPHPRKDKTVPPIDLCSADDMSVSLTFDDGRSVIRDACLRMTSSTARGRLSMALRFPRYRALS